MIIAVPKEVVPGERRVALTPDGVKRLTRDRINVRVESGAGLEASHSDDAYGQAGAAVESDTTALWRDANVVLKVQAPVSDGSSGRDEVGQLSEGAVLVCMLQPLTSRELVSALAERRVTSFSLDALPRITRAQSMDALSSMSTISGYKAVLLCAAQLGKFFPMLVTAAGTVAPSRVLVLGAGVAGLQAIATARRLGAVVEAFDVRPVVKEQVESLGAKFIAPEAVSTEAEGAGGYATELSEDQHKRELELIHSRAKDVDAVITTALIPGRPAPVLVTEAMVRDMKPGSIVVDLAAEMGGNCELTEKGESVERHGVTVMGPLNLPATMPVHASQMYARNMSTFVAQLIKDGELTLNFEDEIIAGTCITHEGKVVHEATRKVLEGGNG